MTVVWYLIFLAATYIVALQIFRLTTYHASFFKGAPLLLGYSVLVGYLLFVFNLAPFFIWHLVANVVLFTVKLKGEAKQAKRMLKALGVDPQQQYVAQMSFSSTRAHYILSVLVYLIGFAVSFLAIYNLSEADTG